MRSKNIIWYVGYVVSACLILIIFVTDFSKSIDIALAVLFSAIFSVSHTQILHNKLIKTDDDYKVNVMDERNIMIKEKAGNITNMVTIVFLSLVTVIFIALDYIIPAIFTGAIIALQPIVIIVISSMLEKKM